MRGKQSAGIADASPIRITPAHAGKTRLFTLAARISEDHPRACGENFIVNSFRVCAVGSPPRMRGKRESNIGSPGRARITPAHAGKTITTKDRFGMVRDHPRACGENVKRLYTRFLYSGSPPRMRGKQARWAAFRRRSRITPAHAGKTNLSLTADKLL